jgi:arylsulfatase A-like enzyme
MRRKQALRLLSRLLIHRIAALILILSVTSLSICSLTETLFGQDDTAPNIILILADDLGWRDTGVYGSTFYETPNIDALAARGVRFTDAYSASPLCSPTRASILTGQYPGRLRLTTPACHLPQEVLDPVLPERASSSQKAVTPQTRTRLPNEEYWTIAESLQAVGYTTGFFGKWHLGRAPYIPEQQGFETVVGGRHHPGPPNKPGGPGSFFGPWDCETVPDSPDGAHISNVITDEAIRFLERNASQAVGTDPFFMAMWYYDVHAPFEAIEELKVKYAAKAEPDNPQHCPTMGGMIDILDQNMGRLLSSVERLGLDENSVIIFASDNGGNMYNEVDGTTPTNNWPLRNGKGNIYEGGQRVPLIVVWPGRIGEGRVESTVVSSIDFYPTILEILSLEPQTDQILDGQSFAPLLFDDIEDRDARCETLEERPLFCHFPHYVPATTNLPSTSVRLGDYKLLRFYADNEDQTDRLELYDLSQDIGERNNLALAMPELAQEMNALIDGFLEETQSLTPAPNPSYSPSIEGWESNAMAELTLQDGILAVKSTGGDPFLWNNALPSMPGPLSVRIRMRSTSSGTGRFFWSTRTAKGFAPQRAFNFEVAHDGEWEEYELMIPSATTDSPVTGIRLDPCTAPGDIEIDWLDIHTESGRMIKRWSFGDE